MSDVDDDRDRVSLEDDHLRHASVLLDDGEVLVVPVESDEVYDLGQAQARRYRRRLSGDPAKRFDR